MIGKRSSMRSAMNIRGISGKWNAMWHSSPVAEVGGRVLRPLVGLGQEHPVREVLVDVRAAAACRKAWVSGRFSQLVPSRS